MIVGIGVDTVETERFAVWRTYPRRKLQRIFSEQEIAYCMEVAALSAQRFAVRFAAKEALLKTLAAASIPLPLLFVCRHASIARDERNHNPYFVLSDELKKLISKDYAIHVSLSHCRAYATAMVVIEKI